MQTCLSILLPHPTPYKYKVAAIFSGTRFPENIHKSKCNITQWCEGGGGGISSHAGRGRLYRWD